VGSRRARVERRWLCKLPGSLTSVQLSATRLSATPDRGFDGPQAPGYAPFVAEKTQTGAREEGETGRLERLLPELVRRFVDGLDRISEGKDVRSRVTDKLPKEALALLLAQLEETKSGLYRAVARELREFLEKTNFSDELARALTKLTLELRTEVRFVGNESNPSEALAPRVKTEVKVKRSEPAAAPTTPSTSDPPTAPPASGAASSSKEDKS